MILSNAPVTEPTHIICDWFEIAVLCNEFGVYSFENLARYWDTLRNSEDQDPEGSNTTEEDFIQRVRSEIIARAECLGESYPFSFSDTGESLEFDPDRLTSGGWVYIFCLLLSHPKQGPVFDGSYTPEITNAVRNYFQACATYAAAGEVEGHSYAFGFPRPDRSGFLDKLKEIYDHFGENVSVVATVPPGAPNRQKDAQIDVIAWKSTQDGAAGKRYILGQVASGENWDAKSIKGGPIESFHNVWFSRQPASIATPSMFVPICYGSLIDQTNEDSVNHHTYEFGHIFYRFRIPTLAKRGLEIAANDPDIIVERLEDLAAIKAWTNTQIAQMRRISSNGAAVQ